MENHFAITNLAIAFLLVAGVTALAPAAQAQSIHASVDLGNSAPCGGSLASTCQEAITLAETLGLPAPPFAVSPLDGAPEVQAGGDPIPTRVACVKGGGNYDFICCEGITGICAGFYDCRVTIGTETSVSCAVDIL